MSESMQARADVTAHVLDDLRLELARQVALREQGKFLYTARDLAGLDPFQALGILVEEVGEVARALLEATPTAGAKTERLYDEVIQVAAVAFSWAEGLREVAALEDV